MRNIFLLQIFQHQFFRIVMTETPSERKFGRKLTVDFYFIALLDLPPCVISSFEGPRKGEELQPQRLVEKCVCLRPKNELAFFLIVNHRCPTES